MAKVFESPKDMADYVFRITDNGGRTADRYTVLFTDGTYLGMSSSPTYPTGVSMAGEDMDPKVMADWVEEGESIDLAMGDLPPEILAHVVDRNNQGLEDFLADLENKVPQAVAASREEARPNEGVRSSLGVGIYLSGDKFMVRLDGDPEDDRGPYDTARDALIASIPDVHGLAGDEYHSTTDVTRLEPDAEIAAAVKALEAKRDEEWRAERQMRPFGS